MKNLNKNQQGEAKENSRSEHSKHKKKFQTWKVPKNSSTFVQKGILRREKKEGIFLFLVVQLDWTQHEREQ